MVKISVIIPVYNAEIYLHKCLDSVFSQEFEDYEVILINDGSTDGSKGIIEGYDKKFPQILRCYDKVNGGLSSARNMGIKMATGKYITFLDSDDYISKDYLKILYLTAEKYESDMVVSGQYKVDEKGEMIDRISYHPDKNGNSVMRRLNISGKIYKRKFIEKHKIKFPHGKTYEDNPFNLIAYFLSENLRFLDYEGYYQVVHEGSITSKKIEYDMIPVKAIRESVEQVENNRILIKDPELFEFTVMSFFTYFIFVRNKKKEYLQTDNRRSDLDVVIKVCDDFQNVVKKNFKNYTKNKYCGLFINKSLQLKQKLGVRIFSILVRTNTLKPFTRMYYYL